MKTDFASDFAIAWATSGSRIQWVAFCAGALESKNEAGFSSFGSKGSSQGCFSTRVPFYSSFFMPYLAWANLLEFRCFTYHANSWPRPG